MLQPGANVLVYVGPGPIALTTLLAPLNGLYSAATVLNPGGAEISYLPGQSASPLVLTNARVVIAVIRSVPVPPGLVSSGVR